MEVTMERERLDMVVMEVPMVVVMVVDMEGVMVDMEEDIEEDMVEDAGGDLYDNVNSLTAFDLLFLYFKITWCWFAHFMLNIGMNIVHS